MAETKNLMQGLIEEMNRCRELLKEYEAIPTGVFGATMLKRDIANAEQAIIDGDVVKMLTAYAALKECQ